MQATVKSGPAVTNITAKTFISFHHDQEQSSVQLGIQKGPSVRRIVLRDPDPVPFTKPRLPLRAINE